MSQNEKLHYILTSETVIECGSQYRMFGFSGTFSDGEIEINGITDDRQTMERLVKLMNDSSLEYCHIRDIAEDILYKLYGIKPLI